MVGVVEPQEARSRALSGHVLGAAGGLALALTVIGLMTGEQGLRDQLVQDPATRYAWGIVGLFAVTGVLVAAAGWSWWSDRRRSSRP